MTFYKKHDNISYVLTSVPLYHSISYWKLVSCLKRQCFNTLVTLVSLCCHLVLLTFLIIEGMWTLISLFVVLEHGRWWHTSWTAKNTSSLHNLKSRNMVRPYIIVFYMKATQHLVTVNNQSKVKNNFELYF